MLALWFSNPRCNLRINADNSQKIHGENHSGTMRRATNVFKTKYHPSTRGKAKENALRKDEALQELRDTMPNSTPNISSELTGSKVRSGDRVLNLSARPGRRDGLWWQTVLSQLW